MTARARLFGLTLFLASGLCFGLITSTAGSGAAAEPQVVSTSPVANAVAEADTEISVQFDTAIAPASIDGSTFRVFGKHSGTAAGSFSFANSNQTVIFTPAEPFRAGEFVLVNLSHDITAADTTPLRSEGYAFQFVVKAQPSGMVFQEIDSFSNTGGPQTRIYGAMAADLDNDDFVDLMTVNEVSADVRVFLNLGDGSGLFDHNWLTPEPIGVESSPNEAADFDNDGNTDAAISATDDELVSILLGAGDGNFSSTQFVNVGSQPHGIAVLDVDGDADLDIVNANRGGIGGNLSLMINDGNGTFGAPTFFDSGASGEYGLTSGDMNGDGITDLVVASIDSQEICTMIGNGNGTFTAAPAQDSGGLSWVVVVGDVDGDLNLDAAVANSTSGNVAVLIGNGNGTYDPPDTIPVGFHIPSVDLGDLDGDDDAELLLSSFGGGFWRLYTNDGTGTFTFFEETPALSSPSCAVLYDGDNDGDVDVALTDEIADVVKIMENTDGSSLCPAAPAVCRTAEPGRSSFALKNDGDDTKDRLIWKWSKGQATPKADFGDPVVNGGEDYELCVYDSANLIMNRLAPAGGVCAGKPCWQEKATGFLYKDSGLTPAGINSIKLGEGLSDGKAKVMVKGRGGQIAIPLPSSIAGTLDVRLHQKSTLACWGATFSQPFLTQDTSQLKAKSD